MRFGFSAVVFINLAALASLTDVAIADESEACPPSAVLSGDVELGADVSFELALRGIFTENIPQGCPVIRVTLAQNKNTVSVAVTAQGRRAARDLSNSQTAAIWIETWARDDLEAPLLSARPITRSTMIKHGDPPRLSASMSSDSAALSSRSRKPVILIPSFEVFDANDESRWRALRFAACKRFGIICAGGSLRLADNLGFSHNNELSLVNRRAAELQATVGLPIPIGQATAEPSVGVGLGWLDTRRASPEACSAECAPEPPYAIDDGFTRTSIEATFEGRLTLSFVISKWLSFELSGAVVLRPFANEKASLPATLPSDDSGDDNPGDGRPDGGPNEGPGEMRPLPAEAYELPGEPNRVLGVGIGLRISL